LHARIRQVYAEGCDTCINLSAGDIPGIKELLKKVGAALAHLHKEGKYDHEQLLKSKAYSQLVAGYANVFEGVLTTGIVEQIPTVMYEALKNDIFLFSGLKSHALLTEGSSFLLNDQGKPASYSEFRKAFTQRFKDYNENYLQAEYQFAQGSAQMAANWAEVDDNGLLQYRTAQDERVRDEHRALADITLPKKDPFWNSYYPPNGWRCRCTAVEVLPGKYLESDSADAIEKGEKATTQLGKDGANRLEIFRFNSGQSKVIFPPEHPYRKLKDAGLVLAAAELNLLKEARAITYAWSKENIPLGGMKLIAPTSYLEESFLTRSTVKKMMTAGHQYPIEKATWIRNIDQNIKESKYIGWAEDEVFNGVKKHTDVLYWKYYQISISGQSSYMCVKYNLQKQNLLYSIEEEVEFKKIRGIKKGRPKT
jgi:SPP1 gp7 family putative phage head morphogenesis protein